MPESDVRVEAVSVCIQMCTCSGSGFGVWGLGSGVWGLWFVVCGLWFGVWGLGFGVWGLGFGVWSLGFGVRDLRFGVCGFGISNLCSIEEVDCGLFWNF